MLLILLLLILGRIKYNPEVSIICEYFLNIVQKKAENLGLLLFEERISYKRTT